MSERGTTPKSISLTPEDWELLRQLTVIYKMKRSPLIAMIIKEWLERNLK